MKKTATLFCVWFAFAAVAVVTVFSPNPAHGQFVIDSLEMNGELSWNDPVGTGTHYAVQWTAPGLGLTNWYSWQDAQARLSGLGPTGSVFVPMNYRMVTPDPTYRSNATYSYYFEKLPLFNPLTPLETNEMRITFMGTMIPLPVRRAQAEMSVFVEVGWNADPTDTTYQGRAVDQFVFDCGAGVSANYAAAVVGFRRMDKVFINHLHADHMNDLAHIYGFGPAADRKSPLYVFGQSKSGVPDPVTGVIYEDGTSNFCANARNAWRWHSESFSFQTTAYTNYMSIRPTKETWGLPNDPIPVGDDSPDDAYALVPIELDWSKVGGVAYSNAATGVKITHFPVIHARKGSMGYKIEWKNPKDPAAPVLSAIYTSDTKPETNCIEQAKNDGRGVDVFIHEMVVPPAVWAMKNMGLPSIPPAGTNPTFDAAVAELKRVQDSSHTPQGAFGYLLSQLTNPPPRLTVATHFPVADDTVASAFDSVKAHCPDIEMGKDLVWSFDLMVLRVFPDRIVQCRAVVSDYSFNPPVQLPPGLKPPKYRDDNDVGNPFAQIDPSAAIPAVNEETGERNYSDDGF